MYIRPWPTQVEAHSLKRPWVNQLRMALDPTSEPTPWCVPALITSATSGDKLPFTVVRLALSLVQYGRTLRLWPGQNTTEGDRCKVGSRPAVPLSNGSAISPQQYLEIRILVFTTLLMYNLSPPQ